MTDKTLEVFVAVYSDETSAGVALEDLKSMERARSIRSEEHTFELQSHVNLVCRLLLEKKKKREIHTDTPIKNSSRPTSRYECASTHPPSPASILLAHPFTPIFKCLEQHTQEQS